MIPLSPTQLHVVVTAELSRSRKFSATSLPGDGFDPQKSVRRYRAVALAVSFAWLTMLPVGLYGQAKDPFFSKRHSMVENQIRRRGIEEPDLLAAMQEIPRHAFVPDIKQREAYDDVPIKIADGQTLSQAYLSALMISLLELDGDDKVLEVGTGSGYDAAILSRMARQVYTIEIDPVLGNLARRNLEKLKLDNVRVRIGDGYRGWPEEAPFDAILLTTAPERIPEPLFEQLRVGGRLVVALGDFVQDLQVITKTLEGRDTRKVSPVRLGPMTGEVTKNKDD